MKPEPIMKSKGTEAEGSAILETELKELKVMYEYLENQLQIKNQSVERLDNLSNL